MIIVTGGAGFIGSCLVWQLNEAGYNDIVVADELGSGDKWKNIQKRLIRYPIHFSTLFDWIEERNTRIDAIFHMGACSTTTEQDTDYLMQNNLHYSVKLFKLCAKKRIPFIYASSAATYGDGSFGYNDLMSNINLLRPINKYGFSKHVFDRWAITQEKTPPVWVGLKFFNVYGPQEYHKGSQASVAFHAYNQILKNGSLKLFKSYKEGVADGEQQRDFVYIKDVTRLMLHLLDNLSDVTSGIYNVGTGTARTFLDLGKSVFEAMHLKTKIEWIDMPEGLKDQYQYFTQASLDNLIKGTKWDGVFTSLESGVSDYIQNYLAKPDSYL